MKCKILFASLFAVLPLLAEIKVLTFAGSTRSESLNKKLALEAAEMAREMGADVTTIDLRDYPIPFYDRDLEMEAGMPEHAKRFRKLMLESDVVLIATPEYNGSIPGVLKNALDWASRTEDGKASREAFKDRKFGIMGVSGRGGTRALAHLRAILEGEGGKVVEAETAIAGAHVSKPEKEKLKVESLKRELAQLIPIKTDAKSR